MVVVVVDERERKKNNFKRRERKNSVERKESNKQTNSQTFERDAKEMKLDQGFVQSTFVFVFVYFVKCVYIYTEYVG